MRPYRHSIAAMRGLLLLLAFAAITTPYQSIDQPLPIGGDVKAPTLIHTGDVVLPEMWDKKMHNVHVMLTLVVDEQGIPRNVVVKQADLPKQWWAIMEKNVETQYRFRPATLHGTPVAVWLNEEIFIDGF